MFLGICHNGCYVITDDVNTVDALVFKIFELPDAFTFPVNAYPVVIDDTIAWKKYPIVKQISEKETFLKNAVDLI